MTSFGMRSGALLEPERAISIEHIPATAPAPGFGVHLTLDGYGEHEDGRPFDGTGVGRGWPLLAGERGHYELAAGNRAEAERLLGVMAAQASDGGMIPEQVWDSTDLAGLELLNGRPSGSAMPLVWAHAEYVKLLRSLRDGKDFDLPPQTVERYLVLKTHSPFAFWRFNQKCSSMPRGKTLRVETLAPARVHWSADAWRHTHDTPTRDTGLGVHYADLATGALPAASTVRFTFYWPEAGCWEGEDFPVEVEAR
jgi:glucoamylase